jgi:hypothetical protein
MGTLDLNRFEPLHLTLAKHHQLHPANVVTISVGLSNLNTFTI